MEKLARQIRVALTVAALIWLPSLCAPPLRAASQLSPASPALVSAAALGTNLIVNGDAESGAGSTDGSIVFVPGWDRVGNWATVVQYGSPAGFPAASSAGPANRGANFFAGGPDINGQGVSYLTQSIDVSSLQSRIVSGTLSYVLQGYFGGYATDDDYAGIKVYFLTACGQLPEISSAQAGPVTAADRGNVTGLLSRRTTGTIPAATRCILVNLDFNRFSGTGTYNDGYADNLSLVLGGAAMLPIVSR
jgi:hypothetical protein